MNYLTDLFGVVGVVVGFFSLFIVGAVFLQRPKSAVSLNKGENGFVGSDQEPSIREKDRQKVLVRNQQENLARNRHSFLTRRGQLAPAVVQKNGRNYAVQMRDYYGRGIGPTFERPAAKIFIK